MSIERIFYPAASMVAGFRRQTISLGGVEEMVDFWGAVVNFFHDGPVSPGIECPAKTEPA
jgi:hypothetical protein